MPLADSSTSFITVSATNFAVGAIEVQLFSNAVLIALYDSE